METKPSEVQQKRTMDEIVKDMEAFCEGNALDNTMAKMQTNTRNRE